MSAWTNGLTQEQIAKVGRAILLERAGKLTPDQQAALDELRASEQAPAKLSVPQKPRAMSPFEAGKIGPIPGGEEVGPPEAISNPTEALPSVGATVGAALGGASGGLPAVGGAALGGAAGESAKQLIDRATGFGDVPKTSGEAAGQIAIRGAIEGGIEGISRGVAGAGRGLVNFFSRRVTARDAGKALAQELHSGNLSPKELGDELQAFFDASVSKESQSLKAVKDRLAKENPDLNVPYNESKKVVDAEISRLKKEIADFPSAGTTDPTTGKGSRQAALAFLEDFRQFFNRENFLKHGNLDDVFRERSRAFNMSQTAKGELQGLEENLSRAVHQDLGAALKGASKGRDFLEFEAASSRFREVKSLGDVEKHKALARVFGDKRIDAEKVAEVLFHAPEDAVQAIKILRQQGGEEAVAPVRKAIFLKVLEKDRGGQVNQFLLDDNKVRAIFGQDTRKVRAFAKAVEEAEINKAGGGATRRAISFVTFPIGNMLGGGPIRVGVNDATGTILEIPAKRLAQFLDNPAVFKEFTAAMSKEPSGATAANLIRLLSLVATTQRRDERIATIGEVQKSKEQ